ncbi:MAG: hypothetical protein D6772_01840, partial [Bacteroidetes bacterium]
CELSQSRDFSIVAAPNAGSARGPDRACFVAEEVINLADLLSDADPGGRWEQTEGPPLAGFDPNTGRFTPSQPGLYRFIYRVSGNGPCGEDIETLTIERSAPPSVELASTVVLDCNFPTAELGGANTTSGPDVLYRWWRDGIPLTATSAQLTVEEAGTYELVVTDANGCEARDSAVVIDQIVELALNAIPLPAPCDNPKGGGIRIVAVSGGTEPYLSSLNGSPFSMVDTYTELAAGTYELRVQDAGGCEGSSSIQLVEPVRPTLLLSAEQEEPLSLGESLTLSALTSISPADLDTLIWQPHIPDSLAIGNLQWRISPLETTNYQLTLIDRNGCSVSAELLVPVSPAGKVFIPNAISPNEDGHNDCFVIYDAGAVTRIVELQIFNRWGSQVYASRSLSTNSESGAWDGRLAGQRLPADVYIYSLTIEWISGEVSRLSGEIHLVY